LKNGNFDSKSRKYDKKSWDFSTKYLVCDFYQQGSKRDEGKNSKKSLNTGRKYKGF